MFIFNKQTILIVLLISLSGLSAACRSRPTLASPSAAGISVGILGDECPSVEVKAGQQVTWTNQDARAHVVRHKPADGDSQFDSGILNMDDSFSFTFVQPGVYTYQWLTEYDATGTVSVQP
jgi:plastocyanin